MNAITGPNGSNDLAKKLEQAVDVIVTYGKVRGECKGNRPMTAKSAAPRRLQGPVALDPRYRACLGHLVAS